MIRSIAFAGLLALSVSSPASAQSASVVSIGGGVFGGGSALLERPAGRPVGSIVLIPGGDGNIGLRQDGSIARAGNQLVRSRLGYVRAGFATLTLDAGADAGAAVASMREIARPVVLVSSSRGTLRVPGALASRPDALVLTSGMLDDFQASVGSPAALPPTLIVHHRQDGCRVTLPALVEPFIAWSAGRARAVWLDGGSDEGNPCQPRAHHGFAGLDGAVTTAIVRFARSAPKN